MNPGVCQSIGLGARPFAPEAGNDRIDCQTPPVAFRGLAVLFDLLNVPGDTVPSFPVMPTPRVVSILDPALLLEHAVEGLFPLPAATDERPWPTLSAWVVLRQGGLRDDLHRLAAQRHVAGWFDPPVCLFNEVGQRWGSETMPRPLTEPERHAILSGLIDRCGGTVFHRSSGTDAWVPAVDHLIGELVSEGIDAVAFSTRWSSRQRTHSLVTAPKSWRESTQEWLTTLARAGRADGRDGKVRLAAEINADPRRFAERLGGRRDIRIVGLADLRGGWRQLIGALAASPALDRLEILTTFRLELPAALGAEYIVPDVAPKFADVLFSEGTFEAPTVRLVEAPDAAREVELIAVRVRALLDGGVSPSRIAVVARQARPLVNEVSAALTRLGVPVTARRRTGLSHTAPARALRAMLVVGKRILVAAQRGRTGRESASCDWPGHDGPQFRRVPPSDDQSRGVARGVCRLARSMRSTRPRRGSGRGTQTATAADREREEQLSPRGTIWTRDLPDSKPTLARRLVHVGRRDAARRRLGAVRGAGPAARRSRCVARRRSRA